MNKYKLIERTIKKHCLILLKNQILSNFSLSDLKENKNHSFIKTYSQEIKETAIISALVLYTINNIKFEISKNPDMLEKLLKKKKLTEDEFYESLKEEEIRSYGYIGEYLDTKEKLKKTPDKKYECYLEHKFLMMNFDFQEYFDYLEKNKIDKINEYVQSRYKEFIKEDVTDEEIKINYIYKYLNKNKDKNKLKRR